MDYIFAIFAQPLRPLQLNPHFTAKDAKGCAKELYKNSIIKEPEM